jgi:Zn-finger nucleic acid-binding protein
MNCPSCGAPMRLEGAQDCLTCDYCKCIYYPQADDDGVRVLPEQAAELCPICALPLMHAILARQRIRYCTRCRGMLIPMAQFVGLIAELKGGHPGRFVPRVPDHKELDRHIDCPQCLQRMDTHFYGGPGNIVIDDCSRCELNWLDRGELMHIVEAPDRLYAEEAGFGPPLTQT